jgi:hypothetical protein
MVLGTNNNDSLNIQLLLPAATVFTLDTAQWQLEQTSAKAPAAGIPTAFEYRGQQAEQARVSRYYQQVSANARFNASAGAGIYMDVGLMWPAMRGVPATSVAVAPATVNNGSPPAVIAPTIYGARFEIVSAAAGDCYALNGIYNIDARL